MSYFKCDKKSLDRFDYDANYQKRIPMQNHKIFKFCHIFPLENSLDTFFSIFTKISIKYNFILWKFIFFYMKKHLYNGRNNKKKAI